MNLANIPEKEENTVFVGERTSKGLIRGSSAQSMPKGKTELSSPSSQVEFLER